MKFSSRQKKFIFSTLLFLIVGAAFFGFAEFARAQTGDGLGLEPVSSTIQLSSTDIRVVVTKIIRAALALIGIVLVVLIIYAGFLWMTAGGNEERITSAKSILRNAIIGLIIILSAYAIATFVINKLLEATGDSAPAHCGNGTLDVGVEVGVDCGGECPACGGGEGGLFGSFYIISKTSGNSCIRNVHPKITFNINVDKDTMSSVTVTNMSGEAVPGSWDWARVFGGVQRNVAEFTPRLPAACGSSGELASRFDCLAASTTYSIHLSTGVGSIRAEGDSGAAARYPLNCSAGAGCGDSMFTSGAGIDVANPTIAILEPPDESIFRAGDIVTTSIRVTDDSGLETVNLDANGRFVGGQTFSNCIREAEVEIPWNTGSWSTGLYTLSATARDWDGGSAATSVQAMLRPESCFEDLVDRTAGFACPVTCGGECGTCEGGTCSNNLDCSSGSCESGRCVNRPKINSVTPLSGAPGNLVSLSGCFFGTTTGHVYFGVTSTASSTRAGDWREAFASADCPSFWSNNQIIAEVPSSATGAGPLRVRTAPRLIGASTAPAELEDTTRLPPGRVLPDFQVTSERLPGLCSAEPDRQRPDEVVTLRGKNLPLSSVPPRHVIMGGLVSDSATWASASRVDATVPLLLSAGLVDVKVRQGDRWSNGIRLRVLEGVTSSTPIIESVTPASGARGQYITIRGRNFGNLSGRVLFKYKQDVDSGSASVETVEGDLISFPVECGGRVWRDEQIIVKFPSTADSGTIGREYYVVVVTSEDRRNPVGPTYSLVSGIPSPGLCALVPSTAPIPYPSGSERMRAIGEYFTSPLTPIPDVYFWRLGASATTTSGRALAVHDSLYAVTSLPAGQSISLRPPTSTDSGPVVVYRDSIMSNPYSFSKSDCRAGGECETGSRCCAATGMCVPATAGCEGERRESAYIWRFSTKDIPRVPHVVERCGDETENPLLGASRRLPSPSPSVIWDRGSSSATIESGDHHNVCRSAVVSVEFNMPMNSSTLNSDTVKLYKCEGEPVSNSCASVTPVALEPSSYGLDLSTADRSSLEIKPIAAGGGRIAYQPRSLFFNGQMSNTGDYPWPAVREDYVEVPDSSGLDFGTASFTYELWFKPSVSLASFDMPIYKGGSTASDAGFDMELGRGRWSAFISDGLGSPASLLQAYFGESTTSQWVHLAAVVERGTSSSNQFRAYLNGRLISATTIPSAFGSVSNDRPLRIGGGTGNPARGYIDEVKIYGRALSGSEVLAHYNDGNGVYGLASESGLAAGWHFDEGASTLVSDFSGRGHNGIVRGAAWSADNFTVSIPPGAGEEYAALWDDNSWYQVVLSRNIKSVGNSDSSANLALDRSCSALNSAYCFVFRTDARNCRLRALVVTPYEYATTRLTGLDAPLRHYTAGGDSWDLYFTGHTLSDQRCIMMNPPAQGWSWRSASTTYADIYGPRINRQAMVSTLQNTVGIAELTDPDNAVSIVAQVTTTDNFVTGASTLTIDLTRPEVVEYWPNCLEACPNGDVGARFNMAMSNRNLGWRSVQLLKCEDENCFTTTTVAITAEPRFIPDRGSNARTRLYIPHNNLEPSTLYQVKLSSASESYRQLWSIGRLDSTDSYTRPFAEEFTWRFRTKRENCRIERVGVVPSEYIARRYNDRALYMVEPYSAPDSCSVQGQRLNAWEVNWSWGSSDWLVATTTSFMSRGFNRFCTASCVKKGSQSPYSSAAPVMPVCGDRVTQAGEDCDPPSFDSRCGLDCRFMGNTNVTSTTSTVDLGLCGDGFISSTRGEACDVNDSSTRGVGCSSDCRNMGSRRATGAGEVTASICGNGGPPGFGEDCDIGNPASVNSTTSSLNCTADCLHTGTRLLNSWCLTNTFTRGGFATSTYWQYCGNAMSQCGDGWTDPDEDDGCETGDHSRDVPRPAPEHVPAPPSGNCSEYCLKNSALKPDLNPVSRRYPCETATSTGCNDLRQHIGSSLTYNDPSVCGDGVVGVGEDEECESDLIPTFHTGKVDPWVLAVGVGQSTNVTGTPPSQRAHITATTTENTAGGARSGSGDFVIPCGYSTDAECQALYGTTTTEYGVGANSCCYARPKLVSVYPGSTSKVETKVCPNTVIEAVFDRAINPATLSTNLLIARGIGRTVPSAPEVVGSKSGNIKDMSILGRFAYLAMGEAGIAILDISRADEPLVTSTAASLCRDRSGAALTSDCETRAIEVSGNFAYVGETYAGAEIISTLRIFNISTSSLNEVGYVTTAGRIEQIRFRAEGRSLKAYLATGEEGLKIVDVTSSTSPLVMGSLNTTGTALGLAVTGDYAYVADGNQGLRVINIASSTRPAEVGFASASGTALSVDIAGNYAFVAEQGVGLRVLDIYNRRAPTSSAVYVPSTTITYSPESVSVADGYAYISNGPNGLLIVDVSNERTPTLRYNYLAAGRVRRALTRGDLAYLGGGGFKIIDLSFLTSFNCSSNDDVTALVTGSSGATAYLDNQPWYKKIWHNIAMFFKRLFGAEDATASRREIESVKWCAGRDLGNAAVAPIVGATTTSRVLVNLRQPLAFNTDYAVILKEGIKDNLGVSIGRPATNTPYQWKFITGDTICQVNQVNVIPDEYMFNAAGATTTLEAQALTNYGARIQSLPGFYSWQMLWGPYNNPYVDIANTTSTFTTTTALNRNGEVDARASATIVDNIYTNQYGIAATGRSHLTVFLCTNPWPPKDLYYNSGGPYRIFPFEDKFNNNDNYDWVSNTFDNRPLPSSTVPNAGDRGYFNFRSYYCADNGGLGTFDDLPYMRPIAQVTTTVTSATSSYKRFILTSDKNGDAVGMQIFPNPNHLTASEWFNFATSSGGRGFSGQLRSITVGGYPAITDGNNTYVDVLHYATSTDRWDTYIYLFSVNSDADAETRNVFEQLMNNLRFNINIPNIAYCGPTMDAPGVTSTCLSDLDCSGGEVCGNQVDKMKRNYERLRDLREIETQLENYSNSRRESGSLVGRWEIGQGYAGEAGFIFPGSGSVNRGARCDNPNCPALVFDYRAGTVGNFPGSETTYIQVTTSPQLNFSGNFTIEAMIKRTSSRPNEVIVGKGEEWGATNENYALRLYGGEVVFTNASGVNEVRSGLSTRFKDWSLIRVAVSNSAVEFYVDGQVVSRPRPSSFPSAESENENLKIGGDFLGLIDYVAIYNRAMANDTHPDLREGTYLTGHTLSTWPSWTVLSSALGGGLLPVDPINRLAPAGTCTPSTTFYCATDSRCVNATGSSTQTCTMHDPTTGWSAADRRFSFACASSSFAYRYNFSTSTGYLLRTRWEEMGFTPANINNFKNSFVNSGRVNFEGICTQEEEVSTISPGRCGDGQVNLNLGEQCDPQGRIEQNRSVCTDVDASYTSRTCTDGCQWGDAVSFPCKSLSVCGNGVLELGETCDEGRFNGRYNRCNDKCNGRVAAFNPALPNDSPGFCGDGQINSRFEVCDTKYRLGSSNGWCLWGINYGEACDTVQDCDGTSDAATSRDDGRSLLGLCGIVSPARGRYDYARTSSCAWDCQGYSYNCGDGVVQSEFGEECDGNQSCGGSGGGAGARSCDRNFCRKSDPVAVKWWRFNDVRYESGDSLKIISTYNSAISSPSYATHYDRIECGAETNCPRVTTIAKYDSALLFDGNDYLQTNHVARMAAKSFTVEAWLNPNFEAGGTAEQMRFAVARKGLDGEANGWGLYLLTNAALGIDPNRYSGFTLETRNNAAGSSVDRYRLYNYTSAGIRPNYPNASGWMHVAAAYDGTLLRLYVNGELAASSWYADIPTTTRPFVVGKKPDGSPAEMSNFKGVIDEVSYYDRALTADEIRGKYQSGWLCPAPAAPAPSGDCGDSRVSLTEACDRGRANNGVPCTPAYGRSCTYCSENCEHLINVLPTAYCGNGVIEGVEVCDTDPADTFGAIWASSTYPGAKSPVASSTHNGYRVYSCGEEENSQVNTFEYFAQYSAMKKAGGYVYAISGSNRFDTIDISNPARPHVTSYLTLSPAPPASSVLTDIEVSGNFAYVTNNTKGLYIIDISARPNPVQVGANTCVLRLGSCAGNYASVLAEGRDLFVAVSGDGDLATPPWVNNMGLRNYKLANPSPPAYQTTHPQQLTYERFKYVVKEGNNIYLLVKNVSDHKGYVFKLDKDLNHAGAYSETTMESADKLVVDGDRIYTFNNVRWPARFSIIDKSTMTLLKSYVTSTAGGFNDMTVRGGYIYLAHENGLHIINAVNPVELRFVASFSFDDAESVVLNDRYAYVSIRNGLKIIDISDPEIPRVVDSAAVPKKGTKSCASGCGRVVERCVECGKDEENGVEVRGSMINALDPRSLSPLQNQKIGPALNYQDTLSLYYARGQSDPFESLISGVYNLPVAYEAVANCNPMAPAGDPFSCYEPDTEVVRFDTYTLRTDLAWPLRYRNAGSNRVPASEATLLNSNSLCSSAATSSEWRYRMVINNDRQPNHVFDFPVFARALPWQYDMVLSPIIRTTNYPPAGATLIQRRPQDMRVVISWTGRGEFMGGFLRPTEGLPADSPSTIEGTSLSSVTGIFYYNESGSGCDRCRPLKRGGIWHHGLGFTDGGVRAESFTIETGRGGISAGGIGDEDTRQSMEGLGISEYAFYVRSTDAIRNYLTSGNNLKVDLYFPEVDDLSIENSWRHFSRPVQTFYLSNAQQSANPAAMYWHVFNVSSTPDGAIVTTSSVRAVEQIRTNPGEAWFRR